MGRERPAVPSTHVLPKAAPRQGLPTSLLVMLVTLGLSGFLFHLMRDTCHRYAAAKKRYEDLRLKLHFHLKQARQEAG